MIGDVINQMIPQALSDVSVSLVLAKIISVLVIYVAARIAINLIVRAIRRADKAVDSYDLSAHTHKLVANLVSTGIYFIALLLVLWMFEVLPAVYTLLTAAGFVGIVIGFGLKDVLSNFVSGMILAVEQPFKIGDEVEVKTYGGVVEDINIRSTTIKLWDGRLVYIPNFMMLNEPVININRGGKRQVEAILKIAPEQDVSSTVDLIQKVFKSQDTVLKDPEPAVIVNEITPKEVNLKIRFWYDVKKTNYQKAKAKVMGEIKKTLK
ncbi:MAG: mechanosensitive ion channel family protein [Candidatus Altiarchaeota archaeon]